MRLSVIVVAFGKPDLLTTCLVRLVTALERVEGETELIVVLNDGPGEAQERLRSPAIVTTDGSPGLGFAGGVTEGLRVAQGEWIALVNDDCLPAADALAALLAVGDRDRDIGSVAAQVRFTDRPGTVNSAGIVVDDLGVARERLLGEPAARVEPAPVAVFGASATFGLYRRAMLDSLGGLDTSFFAYLEDADLAWRAQAAGWRCVLAPQALAFHQHSASLGHGSKEKHHLVGRNRVRMLAKNASGRQLRRALARIVAYDLLYIVSAGARDRTLAPLTGRLLGVGEWRAYRRAGRDGRSDLTLPRAPGVRDALRRSRIYRASGTPRMAGSAAKGVS